MATYIKTLKEDNGDITYPQTLASAVLTNGGSDVEAEMGKYVTATDIASTSALTPPVQTAMIGDGAVTEAKIASNAVTTAKIKDANVTTAKLAASAVTSAKLGAFEAVAATDYINITTGTINSLTALKFGKLVMINMDISGCNPVAGEKVIGSCTAKVKQTAYGSARVTGGSRMGSASYVAIPSGNFRIYADQAGTGTAGTIWIVEA